MQYNYTEHNVISDKLKSKNINSTQSFGILIAQKADLKGQVDTFETFPNHMRTEYNQIVKFTETSCFKCL